MRICHILPASVLLDSVGDVELEVSLAQRALQLMSKKCNRGSERRGA